MQMRIVALPGERSGVVATVAAAFADDPGWAVIFGDEYRAIAGEEASERLASYNVAVAAVSPAELYWFDAAGPAGSVAGGSSGVARLRRIRRRLAAGSGWASAALGDERARRMIDLVCFARGT